MQPLVACGTIVDVALIVDVQGSHQEGQGAARSLFDVALAELFADFEKLYRGGVFTYQQAAQVVAHAGDEVLRLKAFVDDVVHQQQDVACVALQQVVHNPEVIVVVEHVEVLDD